MPQAKLRISLLVFHLLHISKRSSHQARSSPKDAVTSASRDSVCDVHTGASQRRFSRQRPSSSCPGKRKRLEPQQCQCTVVNTPAVASTAATGRVQQGHTLHHSSVLQRTICKRCNLGQPTFLASDTRTDLGRHCQCGFGETFCGKGVCVSQCDAKAECGKYAKVPGATCPLNVCCGSTGACGTTAVSAYQAELRVQPGTTDVSFTAVRNSATRRAFTPALGPVSPTASSQDQAISHPETCARLSSDTLSRGVCCAGAAPTGRSAQSGTTR